MTTLFTRPSAPAVRDGQLTTHARSPFAGRALAATALAAAGLLSVAGCQEGQAGKGGDGLLDVPDVAKQPAAPPNARQCVQACSSAADCSSPDALPIYDASHFACTGGRCEYTGCKSNAECTATFGQGHVCEAGQGSPVRMCFPVCSAAADCAYPDAPPIYDASHFACVASRCVYTGCKSNAECASILGSGSVCEAVAGSPYRECALTCSTPADCAAPNAQPLYDASHFACVASRCEYTGCKSNAECSGVHGRGWVCE